MYVHTAILMLGYGSDNNVTWLHDDPLARHPSQHRINIVSGAHFMEISSRRNSTSIYIHTKTMSLTRYLHEVVIQ
jgi:DNA integrity scanning protein DisA with diadenylate cyclase activity